MAFFFADFLAACRVLPAGDFFFTPADVFLGDRFEADLLLLDVFFLLREKMSFQFSEYCSVDPTRKIDMVCELHQDNMELLDFSTIKLSLCPARPLGNKPFGSRRF